jgi:hypothetical protein
MGQATMVETPRERLTVMPNAQMSELGPPALKISDVNSYNNLSGALAVNFVLDNSSGVV